MEGRMASSSPAAETNAAVARLLDAADIAVGVSAAATRWAIRGGRLTSRAVRPVLPLARRALRPPGVGEQYWPESVLRGVANRGRQEREAAAAAVLNMVLALVPEVFDAALDQVDLTTVVVDRVDLDTVVGHVDL